MISVRFQGKPFNIMVIQDYAPTSNAEEAEVERFYEELQDLLELKPKKDVLFIIGDWNARVGSQETPGETDKFVLGVANTLFQEHKRRPYTWTSPDVNTEIKLIIFFAAKDTEALYSQQKQDPERTVTQIMNSLFQSSGLN